MAALLLLAAGCDRPPGTYTFITIYEGNDLSDTFSYDRTSDLTEATFAEDTVTEGFIIRDDDLVIRSKGDAVATITSPIMLEASDVTFENLNLRLGADFTESAIIIGGDEKLENIVFRNVTIDTAGHSVPHLIDGDDIDGFTIEGMTIGETTGSSIYLTAADDVDITLLYDGKERKTVEELTENDAAVEFGWDTSRTMRPCSISRLNISSPIYAEAALYISDDGTVWSPPLNTDGQHSIRNEGYSAVTKPLSKIWEDMSLPKTAAEPEEIVPPEGEITVGWWWNHESPDEEGS